LKGFWLQDEISNGFYSASYKLQILEEVDRCDQPGQVAAILCREGLYSSHLTTRQRQRQAGQIAGLTDNKRGRKPLESHPLEAENEQLRQENQRLMQRLEQVEMIIDIPKKASAMLGIVLGTSSTERKA